MKSRTRGIQIAGETRRLLIQKLKNGAEVITYAQEPALASLCTALGLQFELGRKDSDRLSPFFGVDVLEAGDNPWCSEIFSQEGEFALRFWRRDGVELEVRHPDFCHILEASSFNESGKLVQAVIFPGRVAEKYRAKGFELVVVRDWLLASSLSEDGDSRVAYLYANEWEIQNNIAHTQAKLMTQRRLAFSGTHDIVDHLLNADVSKFDGMRSLFLEADAVFTTVFWKRASATKQKLLISYLLGVVLDDLAQPRWYGSQKHEYLARKTLAELLNVAYSQDCNSLALPKEFHDLVSSLRAKTLPMPHLDQGFTQFLQQI